MTVSLPSVKEIKLSILLHQNASESGTRWNNVICYKKTNISWGLILGSHHQSEIRIQSVSFFKQLLISGIIRAIEWAVFVNDLAPKHSYLQCKTFGISSDSSCIYTSLLVGFKLRWYQKVTWADKEFSSCKIFVWKKKVNLQTASQKDCDISNSNQIMFCMWPQVIMFQ